MFDIQNSPSFGETHALHNEKAIPAERFLCQEAGGVVCLDN